MIDAEQIVTLLGDSLTAGYGLKPTESLPRQLAARLASETPPVRVIGAGVSGDPTRDGLRRLDRYVPPQTDLCVVAFGANDMMQLVPTASSSPRPTADRTVITTTISRAGWAPRLKAIRCA